MVELHLHFLVPVYGPGLFYTHSFFLLFMFFRLFYTHSFFFLFMFFRLFYTHSFIHSFFLSFILPFMFFRLLYTHSFIHSFFLLLMYFQLFSTILRLILVVPVRHYRHLSLQCLKDTDTRAGKDMSKQHVQMCFSGRITTRIDCQCLGTWPTTSWRHMYLSVRSLTSHLGAKHTSPFLMG
jgi:hypothetical protein